MSEKFTIAVWNADGTPKTGASVALLGAGTYSGTELGTSGRYYWASIPLGKYFLRVNGVDTGESFAVGDGEELKKSGGDVFGSVQVETALKVYYDVLNPFSGNGAIDTFAGEDSASVYLTADSLSFDKRVEIYTSDGVSSFNVRNGMNNEFRNYVSSGLVESVISRLSGDSRFQAILTDDLGDPYARLFLGVTGAHIQVTAKGNDVEISHYDGTNTDTINLPAVTGETKTLATTADVGKSITDHIAEADPHTQYRLESASVPWSELSSTPTTLSGYGITDAINTGSTQSKSGGLILGGDLGMGTGRINFDDAIFRQYTGNADLFAIYPSASTTGAPSSTNFALLIRRNGESTALSSDVSTQISVAGVAKLTATASALTASEKIVTSASTTTRAGFNIPHSTLTTTPANGDIETTIAGLFARINGVTEQAEFVVKKLTEVSSTPYAVLGTEEFLEAKAGASVFNLPPATGQRTITIIKSKINGLDLVPNGTDKLLDLNQTLTLQKEDSISIYSSSAGEWEVF